MPFDQSGPWRRWIADPDKIRNIGINLTHFKGLLEERFTFLDVGCNRGYVYDLIARELKQFYYTGIDINPDLIEDAKKFHKQLNCEFEVGDIYDKLPKADIVLCSRLIIHLDDPKSAVEGLLRAAQRKLVLFVGVGKEKREAHDGELFRRFSEKTVRSWGDCEIIKGGSYSTVIYG